MTLRHVLMLMAVVAAGWGAGQLVRWAMPVGQDRRGDPVVRAVLAEAAAPRAVAAGADLVMVVFTDYRCPACRAAAPAMERAIRADGRVTTVYRDWPIFGPASRAAAATALAADRQGIYGPLHRRLMAERRPLTAERRDALIRLAGGDPARLDADLVRHRAAIDARLAATARDAARLGLPGTPAYLIGPVLVVGALDEAGFARGFARARRLAAD